MRQKEVIGIQELLKRQRNYMRVIIKMQTCLFDVQQQIAEYVARQAKQAKQEDKDHVLTSSQVCEMLNISKSTLYRLRKNNDLPSSKIEGRKGVFFRLEAIEEYIKIHQQ